MDYLAVERRIIEKLLAEFPTKRARSEVLKALKDRGLPKEFFSNLRAGRVRLKMEHLFLVLDHSGFRPQAWLFNALAVIGDPQLEQEKKWPTISDLPDGHILHESTARAVEHIKGKSKK